MPRITTSPMTFVNGNRADAMRWRGSGRAACAALDTVESSTGNPASSFDAGGGRRRGSDRRENRTSECLLLLPVTLDDLRIRNQSKRISLSGNPDKGLGRKLITYWQVADKARPNCGKGGRG